MFVLAGSQIHDHARRLALILGEVQNAKHLALSDRLHHFLVAHDDAIILLQLCDVGIADRACDAGREIVHVRDLAAVTIDRLERVLVLCQRIERLVTIEVGTAASQGYRGHLSVLDNDAREIGLADCRIGQSQSSGYVHHALGQFVYLIIDVTSIVLLQIVCNLVQKLSVAIVVMCLTATAVRRGIYSKKGSSIIAIQCDIGELFFTSPSNPAVQVKCINRTYARCIPCGNSCCEPRIPGHLGPPGLVEQVAPLSL